MATDIRQARLGDVEAQVKLAEEYWVGESVNNIEKAIKWFKEAAKKDDYISMYNIGWIYQKGDGIDKDLSKAIVWYEKAAEFNYNKAEFNLSQIYRNSPAFHDEQKSFYWLKRAAEHDYVHAYHNLGALYYSGGISENKYHDAFNWYMKAAVSGNVDSMFVISSLYEHGEGVVKDVVKAYNWRRLGLERAHISSDLDAIQDEQKKIQDLKKELSPEQLKQAEAEYAVLKKTVQIP
jgi:TPR repeat protein